MTSIPREAGDSGAGEGRRVAETAAAHAGVEPYHRVAPIPSPAAVTAELRIATGPASNVTFSLTSVAPAYDAHANCVCMDLVLPFSWHCSGCERSWDSSTQVYGDAITTVINVSFGCEHQRHGEATLRFSTVAHRETLEHLARGASLRILGEWTPWHGSCSPDLVLRPCPAGCETSAQEDLLTILAGRVVEK